MTDSNSPSRQGLIFDIKRYAINDGPGIRLTIFFKGCNLNCAWCHNPEGISPEIEKMYTGSRCIACGTCLSVCPEDALTLTGSGMVTDQDRCTVCGKCAEVCPSKAFEMSGEYMTVNQLMEIIEKERIFFEQSGGGVTISGGEPLLQPAFLVELLQACGSRGIHRAVDTAGNIRTSVLLEVARHTDLFLFDLKVMDPATHEKWTGVSNQLIIENLRTLSEAGAEIIIRIPVIGDVNDHKENFAAAADFLHSLPNPVKEVHLLPYHAIAQHKFAKLGRNDSFQHFEEPDPDHLQSLTEYFTNHGIPTQIGG